MEEFLSAALMAVLVLLSDYLVKGTTKEEFRKEHKVLTFWLWLAYIVTFYISFPVGYGYLLVKHLKNKQ